MKILYVEYNLHDSDLCRELRSAATDCASQHNWVDALHPEDRARVVEAARTRQVKARMSSNTGFAGRAQQCDGYGTARSRFATGISR